VDLARELAQIAAQQPRFVIRRIEPRFPALRAAAAPWVSRTCRSEQVLDGVEILACPGPS
jgi:hypothetical protein